MQLSFVSILFARKRISNELKAISQSVFKLFCGKAASFIIQNISISSDPFSHNLDSLAPFTTAVHSLASTDLMLHTKYISFGTNNVRIRKLLYLILLIISFEFPWSNIVGPL